jgi:hypothetical protein
MSARSRLMGASRHHLAAGRLGPARRWALSPESNNEALPGSPRQWGCWLASENVTADGRRDPHLFAPSLASPGVGGQQVTPTVRIERQQFLRG